MKVIPNIHSSEFPAAVIFCVNCKLIETRGEEADLKTVTRANHEERANSVKNGHKLMAEETQIFVERLRIKTLKCDTLGVFSSLHFNALNCA